MTIEQHPERRRQHPVTVRRYAPGDAQVTLAVFLAAVTVTAAADYSPAQIEAWARADRRDLGQWDRARTATDTFVAEEGPAVAGFSDVDSTGYIDMMFVDPDSAHRGVGLALLRTIERHAADAGATRLTVHASLTARGFFAASGFAEIATRHPVIDGIALTNFTMVKDLAR